jgi:hypothetical protein
MSIRKAIVLATALIPAIAILLSSIPAYAITVDYNNLIDDVVFDNYNTLSAGQVDTFLNDFPNSCISSNNGFRAPDPTGYNPTNGFLYGGNVTAGRVITDAARAYQINPEVLLATMQKEQSLVTGGSGICSTLAYTGAMGYGCPDGGTAYNYSGVDLYTLNGHEATSVNGTCVNSKAKAGFSQQVIHATWLLKFDRERSEGRVTWAIITSAWNNNDDLSTCYGGYMTQGTFQRCPSGSATYYDGITTIDGSAVHMDNGATAALYDYTPHKSGNTNFDTIYTAWFGSVRAPSYLATFYAQSPAPTIRQGNSATVTMSYINSGHSTWYDDTSLSGAPFNTYPLHLSTAEPLSRASHFSAGWPYYNRPARNFSAVYESDGTTLAADQHVVQPGEIAQFSFSLTVPASLAPGTYRENFQPVLEGTAGGTFSDTHTWLEVTVPNPYIASFANQSSFPTMQQNSTDQVYMSFKNVSYATWYDSTSAAGAGTKPVVLASTAPINRISKFNNLFATSSRPATTFAAVYEADGTTLAADQHAVQPGQIAKFSFMLSAPQTLPTGMHREYFQPILEGGNPWDMQQIAWLDVTVTPADYVASLYNESPYPSVKQGNSANAFYSFKNIGNAPWYDITSAPQSVKWVALATTNPINVLSPFRTAFASPSRPSSTFSAVYESDGVTPAPDQHVVQPGQIGKFNYTLIPPWALTPATYKEYYQPILEGGAPWSMQQIVWSFVTVTKN